MRCKFCGFGNGEDDHRCLRCGRRLAGLVIAAPSDYVGSAALSLDRHEEVSAQRVVKSDAPAQQPAAEREHPERQAPLFSTLQPGPKIIPFEHAQRHATARAGLHEPVAAPAPVTPLSVSALTPKLAPSRPASARPQVKRPSLP